MDVKEFRIHAISDTHRAHIDLTPKLTGGDLLVHAGDADCFDEVTAATFLRWCIKVAKNYRYGMVLTAGNHDTYIAEYEDEVRDILEGSNVHLLLNESIVLGGMKIYGSPHSIAYGDRWTAFAGVDTELKRAWEKIPGDTDILVTHSPPFGILDAGQGSQSLLERVIEVKPKVHIFGHIHHEHGVIIQNFIVSVNASLVKTNGETCLSPKAIKITR